MPAFIDDPVNYPVVFKLPSKEVISLSTKQYPVSFVFYPFPRPAKVSSFAIKQLNYIFLDKDIYNDETVCIFTKNKSHIIELIATSKNIDDTDFNMNFYITSNDFQSIATGQVQIINQPADVYNDIFHLFSMAESTIDFNPFEYDSELYYPTASLDLFFYPTIEGTSYSWTDISLPDKIDTQVEICPHNATGILDVLAKVRLRWYWDEARTVVAPTPVISLPDFKFGIRFCMANSGGLFKNNVQISQNGSAIATSVYSTSTAQKFEPGFYHSIFYWGTGSRNEDLFYDGVEGIEIDDNGLPIQYGGAKAFYTLTNNLIDIESSSSSSVSSSSTKSSSLSSLNSSSSSLSSLSSSSLSTLSSSSNSSSSTLSSLSSSTFSSQSLSSHSTSSSSSTAIQILSSSSSSSSSSAILNLSSSSSSLEASVVLYYGFATQYNDFQEILDESGNGHTAYVGQSIYPPTWFDAGGIHGGYYFFNNNTYQTRFLLLKQDMLTDFYGLNASTISVWINPNDLMNENSGTILSITNGYVEDKTELLIGLSATAPKELIVSVYVDGDVKWVLNGPSVSSLIGTWTNVVVRHNGTTPSLYINGILYPSYFSVSYYPSFWIASLFNVANVSTASKMQIGCTSRNYSPYNALGFSGFIDEVKMWDSPLSSAAILEEYQKIAP